MQNGCVHVLTLLMRERSGKIDGKINRILMDMDVHVGDDVNGPSNLTNEMKGKAFSQNCKY